MKHGGDYIDGKQYLMVIVSQIKFMVYIVRRMVVHNNEIAR